MWEPVGPLPLTVYQRRRRMAAAAVSAATLLVVLAGALLLAPEPTVSATRTAGSSASSGGAPGDLTRAGGSPVAGSGLPAGFTTPGGTGTAGPQTSAPGGIPVLATGSPTSTPERLRPDTTPRPSVPVPSPVQVPATGPVPCANGMIKVTAEIDTPDHRVGDRPVLRLAITDVSPQPCVRDLDAARQEIVVWSGDGRTRLWSSNDCGNPGAPDLRTLVPQQPVVSAVTWAGRTSTPGCAAPRTVVPAGAYRVLSRLDDIISAPTPFLLNP